jgi:hypothetical protein
MGKFSHKDIPDFRIQMANEMMFCEHNEMHEIQEAVMTFKPHVRYFCFVIFLFCFLII